MFPLKAPVDTWQLAANSDALASHKPLGIALMDKAIVLYRKVDGAPVALENRCPHRWAPLSDGRVDGDNIVCRSHGFKFCPRGHLVETSGKSNTPGINSATVYPVMERENQIWIWIGGGDPVPFNSLRTESQGD